MSKKKIIYIVFLLLTLIGCEQSCKNTSNLPKEYILMTPTFLKYHKKFVPVPSGWISVNKYDEIIEFIDYGGKRYFYKHNLR